MSGPSPSAEQQSILDLGLTSVKVRAGAGTGKTTTVAMVIANLVASHGVEPEQVVGITFTNTAAAELADRVRELSGVADPARQAEVHTYHGFAAQLLAEFGPLAGLDTRFGVITPTFARQILKDVVMRSSPADLNITWDGTFDRIRMLRDRMGDHLLTPADILAHEDDTEKGQLRREIAEILAGYSEEKRRLGVVDYADLVTMSAGLMTDNPDLAALVRGRYRVVVLDEYQDTNPAQRVLLRAVFGAGFPVIAVGDEDQTIYEWRGASAENFERFEEHFPRPDGGRAHLRSLTLNRRSTSTILEVANVIRRRANPEAEPLASALAADASSRVRTHWAQTSIAEAEWIAARFEELGDSGMAWKDMAVLLRKNKDFAVVVDAFARRDIPVEVANVGGLLSVPEVAELVAWLHIVEHPDDSASLSTILMGSRFRWGLGDLARLTELASRGDGEDHEGLPVPISLLEAVEQQDVPGLRPEAMAALERFRDTYRRVLLESQGLSLVEVCRLILDLTGAWRDVEALPPNQRLTARLNLYRLLDLAQDWSPLQGRPSLPAFLDYLATTKEERSDEVDSARISGQDAVTLVTVHRAKGLEWDAVAIPTVYHNNFPSGSSNYGSPLQSPEAVPIDLRLDTVLAHLPDDPEVVKSHLRQAHNQQEWRTAYVAVTRARRLLFVTGAYWYGYPITNRRPAKPSEFWSEVNAITGEVPKLPQVTDAPEMIRNEAGPAPDPHFATGWEGALRSALADPSWTAETAEAMGVRAEHDAAVAGMEQRLFSLAEAPAREEMSSPAPVSVTGLVTYAQCPRRFFWSEVDPLPRRANPAATRGTEVHRQIELHQRGIVPLESDPETFYDRAGDEAAAPNAYQTYLASRFANTTATLVEQPFNLDVGSRRVRGRIDAIYSGEEGWEVVDFKSGVLSDDPSRVVQLQAYAVAVDRIDFGLPRPASINVTFAYLGGGGSEISYRADSVWIDAAASRLDELMDGIEGERFEEVPGDWCRSCDFIRFCRPGREFLGG